MIVAKTFYELNIQELYEILRLRSEVFVVEQDCVYQDLDGKDQISIHIFQKEKNEVVYDWNRLCWISNRHLFC